MTISPKPLEDYLESFFGALSLNNPKLTDRAPGSGLYTLGRAFASVCADLDLRLSEFGNTIHFSSARGRDLDLLAADYGLIRKASLSAVGSVLVLSRDQVTKVDPQTILTDAETGFQFMTRNNSSVSVGFISETRIPVISIERGPAGNLPAGTLLLSPKHPTLLWTLGSSRSQNGGVRGDLSGGAPAETDTEFRLRILQHINGRQGGTEDALLASLLSFQGVESAEPQVFAPGVVVLWVDAAANLSSSLMSSLQASVNDARPIGVSVFVRQLARRLVSLNLFLVPASGVSLTDLRANALALVQNHLKGLGRGTEFDPISLEASLLSALPVREAKVTPTGKVFCPPNAVIRTSDTRITFP